MQVISFPSSYFWYLSTAVAQEKYAMKILQNYHNDCQTWHKTYWIVRFTSDAFGFITGFSAGTGMHPVPCIMQLLFHLIVFNIRISRRSAIIAPVKMVDDTSKQRVSSNKSMNHWTSPLTKSGNSLLIITIYDKHCGIWNWKWSATSVHTHFYPTNSQSFHPNHAS